MFIALFKGLMLTFKNFFRKPFTFQYPETKLAVPERFRGRPELLCNANNQMICVACGLCEKVCPSQCITVIPETGGDGIRCLKNYILNLNRCSFCGFCVDACPVDAIRMSSAYELAAYSKEDLILDKEKMRANGCAHHSGI